MKNITVAGGITRNAETRRTQAGDAVTSFSVAVSDGFGDKKTTIYFDCNWWGKRGESVAQWLTKGSKVSVTGDLGKREYEGKTYLVIRVADVTLMGGGQERRDGGDDLQQGRNAGNAADDDFDSIPF
jgi:single-strand DNA-binding protein